MAERKRKEFFLGKEFPKHFPELLDCEVRYRQLGVGVPEDGKVGTISHREGSLEGHLPCANPACKKGGFGLGPVIDSLVAASRREGTGEVRCAGYVGARRTEKGPAATCENRLVVEVRLVYAPAQKPPGGGSGTGTGTGTDG